uniref:Signal recognition particle subunit SRP72 n=1 Tax=Panagrolaimus sp. ES5 TaxID=591445 RepID=A0AC34GW05_9BILA
MSTTKINATIRQCCLDLMKAETSRDYERALKISNKLIRQFQKETYAYKCKLVSLIQLGKITEAYDFLKKTSPEQLGDVAFEKAYVYYRRNENEQAEKELVAANQKDPGVIELKAQLAYRLERYDEARNLLRELLRSYNDDFDELRRANLIAMEVHLQSMGTACEPQTDLETFEQIYNVACHQIEIENYNEAIKLLDKALKVCQETLAEDEVPEDEIDEELATILVQKAFALQKLGRQDEALKIYGEVNAKNPSDVNARATLLNNIQSTREEPNISDVRKKLKAAMKFDKTKLSKRQQRTLASNQELIKVIAKLRGRRNKKTKQLAEDTEIVTGKLKTRKRKRKIILPKCYDPDVAPDPERWLPKQERSGYKKKLNKKFKDQHVGRGTQGAAAGAASDKIDYSKASPAPPHKSPATPASPAPAEGPRQKGPAGKPKTSKKKGGKNRF